MLDVKRNSLFLRIVCRGVKSHQFINKPPIIEYTPILKILLALPPTNFTALQLFCNCIQIHYFSLYQTLL